MKKRKKQVLGIIVILILICIGGSMIWKHTGKKGKSLETAEQIEKKNEQREKQASENGSSTIVISSAKAKPGEKVEIKVSVINNPGILGMSFHLSYDEKVLKLMKAENGKAVKNVLDMNHSKKLDNGCFFLWDGEKIEKDQVQDGAILNLQFKVLRSAPEGKYQIKLTGDSDGAVDNDLQVVPLSVDDGFISVE